MSRTTTLRIAEKFIGLPLEQRRQFLDKLRQDGKDFGLLPIPVSRHGQDAIPVSYAQQRLLFLWQLDPGSAAYNMAAGLRLKGELDEARLQRAFDALIERHEALRTVFQVDGEQPLQRVLPAAPLALRQVDLSSSNDPETELARQVDEEVSRPFDLLHGPLLRASLFRVSEDTCVLVVCMHHIVSDGWSMDVMVREFVQAYQAGAESLPPLPLQYADYALWQRRWLEAGEGERQLQHWREQLGEEHPLLEVAPDFPRPPVQSLKGETLRFDFGTALSSRLRETARVEGVTLFMLALAGYALFLSRHSGQRDIRIGVPNANRGREEVEGLIGFFVNTQVLRCVIDERQSLRDLLAQVREATFAAQANQELPFEQLVDVLAPERSLGHNPLFQAKFNQNVGVQKQTALQLPGLVVSEYPLRKEGTHFDLALDITDDGERIHGEMTYASDLYQRASIEGFIASLRVLFETLLERPDAPLHSLAESPAPQPAAERPQPALVLQRWDEQVRRQPEALAAVCADRQLTHAELDARANRLAQHLRSLGVTPGVPVAVLMERSLDWLVGLLGIFKAGGLYMPLDVKAPTERLQGMLQRSGARVLLCDAGETRQAALAGSGCQVQPYQPEHWAVLPAEAPVLAALPEAPAYVIHTSGSTGQPKGVVVSHGALASYVDGLLQRLDLPADASLALVSTIAADLGHTVLFGALCSGRTLHVLPEALGFDPDAFAAYMAEQRIGVLKIVPSHLGGLLQAANAADALPEHALIVGGEACSPALYRKVRELKPGCRFINHYGPSETTVGVLTHEVQDELAEGAGIPLGEALPGARVQVLDDVLNPLPARVAGELYIGGDSLAQGYLGQAALTAERFVPDPFGAPGARLYRSGDRVRCDAEGLLHFLGRADDQVKIRGYRVEPGEVARVLRGLPGVHDAVVLAVPQGDDPAQLQLIGWCVPEDASLSAQALREQLQARLPDYLVPAHLLLLERLPLTANGKLDRRALPQPEVQQKRHVAPSTPVEEQLVAIWQAVLKREAIGVEDNFFELGGDSILSLQIIARAKRQGIKLTPRQLFEKQTIAQLAQVARVDSRPATPRAPAQVSGEMPLLPVQARFFERVQAEPHHYNQAVMLQSRQPLTARVVEQALAVLVAQHDALRLVFRQQADGWRAEHQATLPAGLLWQRQASDAAQLQAMADEAQRSLDLADGPLLRAVLFDLADGSQRLLLVIHHLVVDGVSWRILLEDLEQACTALLAGRTPAPAEKGTAFKAWAERLGQWAREPARDAELAYWQASLSGQADDLPGARRDAGLQVRHARTLHCRLDAETTRQLLQQAPAAYRTQVNDLLLTALARVLCRWSGQGRALVQLEGHGREDLFEGVDLSRTVGWFTSLFPVALSPAEGLAGSIKAIKEQLRGVPDRGIGHGVLRHLGTPAQRAALEALPQARVTFNYLGQFDQGFGDERLFAPAAESVGATQSAEAPLGNWLSVNGQVLGGELELGWTFSQEMFDETAIAALAADYARELTALVGHCLDAQAGGATPADFPLAGLTQAQLEALPVDLREVEDIYPLSPMQEGLLMHTLLEPGSGIYMMQYCYSVETEIDPERFARAWQAVGQRHDALRTTFSWTVGERLLQIVRRTAQPDVQLHDWRDVPAAEHEAKLREMLAEERRQGFDLQGAVPFRLRLIQLGERRFGFVLSNHHILIDAWCRSLLVDEFFELYAALGEGREARLAPASRYADFIRWLKRQDLPASVQLWREQLAGFEQPTGLPFDRQPLKDAGHSSIGDLHAQLEAHEGRQLRELAQRHQLTVNTLVQAAWALVLHRYSGSRDLVFGVTVAGRPVDVPDMQRTVGLFINSIPLRVHLPEAGSATTVSGWLQQLFTLNLRLREHEHLPLVDIQACSEIGKGQSLFDSLFVFENAPIEDGVLTQVENLNISSDSGRTHTNYPMTVVIYPGDALGLHLSYDRRWFDETTVSQLLGDFKRLLLALGEHLEARFDALPLLGPDEREHLLHTFNQSDRDYPLDGGYPRLFEAQAAQHPQRIAASCQGESWSYAQLDALGNRMAQALLEAGVQPDQSVALLAERGLPLLGMILGTLKAAAGYLPLDPHLPAQRLRHILTLSRAPVLVCTEACLPALAPLLAEVEEAARPRLLVWKHVQDGRAATAPCLPIGPRHLAYVIYTSGSTGAPKGVMVEQAGMLNNQLSKLPYLGLGMDDVIAQTASQSFDISVWQFLTAGLCGARVEIVPDEIAHDPEALLNHVNQAGITVLESVPSLIQGMLEAAPIALPGLRWMLTTGEAMPPELARRWLQRYPRIPLVNAYGPAECSDDVSLTRVVETDTGSTYLPIGLPTDNNQLHVLDGQLELVCPRAVGELCISGTGVGRGYVGDPVRTALSFVPDPFARVPGQRLYRSGDLVRRRLDGVLEYVGRVDHQVKIRGFRIELGEIEARIREQEGVRDIAVLAQDLAVGRHLVAYLVADAASWGVRGDSEDDQRAIREALKAALRRQLPDYMVPAHWVLLESMPLNANGKLDRKALAQLDTRQLLADYEAPRSELEQRLAGIWAELLQVERVGLKDNFFELGGHSLLLVRVASRLKNELGIDLPMQDFYTATSIEELAALIEKTREQGGMEDDFDAIFEALDELEACDA
ncbi:amino acid adenylation domain-containing protein [Metapseudomonas otitidis]|uniref:amino acid adenylation domain-containing protein n=1 Tax=Metapseudomonas otitidis TaxID=319939 RepID=UPI003CF4DD7C